MWNIPEITALMIGFLGSFHCVAMCGPIALALSGGNENTLKYLSGRLIYNSGRIVTYMLLGALAGLAGHALMLAGLQKSVSVTIGILMIVSVIAIYFLPGKTATFPLIRNINQFIKKIFSGVLKKRNAASLFIAGLANGILPCGFVYLAMAGAATTHDTIHGAFYMLLFGAGTLPAMMAVAAFGKIAGMSARNFMVKAAPFMMIVLGLYFVVRGFTIKEHNCCSNGTKAITNVVSCH
jgi:sulfite exporter TauE/SafE